MASLVIFRPEKKPTLSMTIRSIARYRMKEERMLRSVNFNMDFIVLHHSISSIGTTCRLMSLDRIRPLLIRMIRSAMGAMA